MQQGRCENCRDLFTRRSQNKNQCFCSKEKCQQSRRSQWHRRQKEIDPDYRKGQKESHATWLKANPEYWKGYREKHPEQVERNRNLQTIRNAKRRGHSVKQIVVNSPLNTPSNTLSFQSSFSDPIAKMDASIPYKLCLVLFPENELIAKMDASNSQNVRIQKTFIQIPLIAKMDASTNITF